MAPLPGAAEVPVGAIVEIQAGKGIVRFNGTTKFAPGRWIGVELSEPKGKNDGSVDGEVYFSCKMKYGMFVRAALIKSIELPSNLGASTSRSNTTV
ncbi:Dynactin, 150 kDa isoform, partial [Tulasnella sp. 408]